MAKRHSEENYEDSLPSTSNEVMENCSKRRRMSYNFWNEENTETESCEKLVDEFKIRDLRIGKFENKKLCIRITYVSMVRKTKIGDVISFHGMDESGEISFFTFGESCDAIYKYLKINSLYSVKNFSVNLENVNYPSGSGNKFQIKVDSKSEIEELDEIENFPKIFFKFLPLSQINNENKSERIDVIGILVKDFGLDTNYKGNVVRELAITDCDKEMLHINLWSANAENFSISLFSVILFRRAVVSEYEGTKKLNCISGTLIWPNPDIPEAIQLKQNFDELVKKQKSKTLEKSEN